MTTLFCDLVGSTELSVQLDPEDFGDLIGTYHRRVAEAVGPYGGFVARHVGDGALIFFGYPEAHEDDPERSVRAALDIVTAVSTLRLVDGHAAQVRIGIATGLVVVGDILGAGAGHDVAGETPNLAARLQSIAAPGSIVVAATTRRLLGPAFDVRELGTLQLRGFSDSVPAYQVLQVGKAVEPPPEVPPLVGREAEIRILDDLWRRARSGAGQVALLAGDAGIGKSRLAAALLQSIVREDAARQRYFCSPYHSNTALFPVIRYLEHAADFTAGDSMDLKRDKLDRLLVHASPEERLLIADMVLVSDLQQADADGIAAARRKEMTLRALLSQVERLAVATPVFLLIEDAHWADPTTLALVETMAGRIERLPVLLLVLARSDFAHKWPNAAHVTTLSLPRLDRVQSRRVVEHVAGDKALPPEVMNYVLSRIDGVPLYAEEMTKSLLESGILVEEPERFVLAGPLPSFGVPTTLQSSLLARLDRLGPARELAQVGAVIGREFDYEMIASVVDMHEDALRASLARLIGSGMVLAKGMPPEATYRFKHALVRDAAYDTLLRERRRALHLRIGEFLEERSADLAHTQAERLARHFTEAGSTKKGLMYWTAAGQQAFARSAMAEAAAHLEEALKLLLRLPNSPERLRQELHLQVALGRALIGARGYTDAGTGYAFERSRVLSDRLNDTANLIRVAHGQWSFHLMRAEMQEARRVARELFDRSREEDTVDLRLNGHKLVGATLIQVGEIAEGCGHLEKAQAIIAAEGARIGNVVQGNDAIVGVPAYRSIGLALLGRYREASMQSEAALVEARRAARPHRRAFALGVAGCWFHGLLDEDAPALHDEWGALIEEQDFPFWNAFVVAFRGLMMAKTGARADGVALVRRGIDQLVALGAAWGPPFFLGSAAPFAAADDGIRMLDEASDIVASTGVAWFAPELHRIRGALMLAGGDCGAAETNFRRAIDEALQQGSRHWQLRAAVSLAGLMRATRRGGEARALLQPIHEGFGDAGESGDLRDAQALLTALGHE